ncbi:hypothetical protein HAX54_052066 [Datura stramonium]|uniref:Uncharacterized protein n=1 Tax=Datura stramonium TaxID=4076 RepID=A0ABS8SZB8_DATST|nr:hypothetical protein [Datura stramonium]
MAAESDRVLKKRKPRVDGRTHRKLGVDQKVEVKSVDDGFLGSWHIGTVIGCGDLIRQVKYNYILSDGCSDNLVETVRVSPIIDGVIPADGKPVQHLGMIRPSPPPREFARWPLPYGQCVDMFYNDAWWEGVVFDREEGAEERRIFFPEMGDEMKGQVDKLRVSQDWDEVTEEWEPRGSWIFLQVIEEIEQLYPLLISVRQIWYEVQLKDADENLKHWTSSSIDIWRKLVKEVVHDNTKLTINHFFSELNSSEVFVEGSQLLEFSVAALEDKLNIEMYFDTAPFTDGACKLDCAATLHIDQNVSNLQPVEKQFVSEGFLPVTEDDQLCGSGDCRSILPSQNEESSVSPHDFSFAHPPVDGTGILSSTETGLPSFVNSMPRRGRPPKKKKKFEGQTLVSQPDCCPEASGKSSMSSIKDIKKPPSEDIAGALSSTKSEPPTFANSKPRRGRPPTNKKKFEEQTLVGEPDCCAEAIAKDMSSMSSIEKFKKPPSNDIDGIFASTESGQPTFANSKRLRERLPTEKKIVEGKTLPGEPESCLEAITKLIPSISSIKEFKRHILHLGWKFVLEMESGIIKKHYLAPDGKICQSLIQVCQVLEESKTCGLVPPVEQSSLYGSIDNSIQSPCMERPQTCSEVPGLPYPSEETIIEPEICRQAVIDYCSPKSQDMSAYQKSYRNGVKIGDTSLKAKKYLAATGWKFCSVGKKDSKMCYRSPEGINFMSFRQACKWCVQKWEAERHLPEQVSSPSTAMNFQSSTSPTKNSSDESPVETPLTKLLREPLQNGKTKPGNKGNQGDVREIHTGDLPELKGKASLKKGDGIGSHSSACDMRSSKRAREVAPSSSNQTPRTVLSWLIDNNVVLPRAKVLYCRKKYGTPMAEGRITREGIKCNCCQNIFGLRNFEAHAGSSCNRPSSNIFLEDGRSLLECQKQMKHKQSVENTRKEPCGSHLRINDHICSVCQYGGELILCDECPSSFHTECLGIKEVPDGDWFCPSCCCKYHPVTFLCSDHARCLRSKGPGKLDKYPEGNWFCNKSCELIFSGMHHLLGKPVTVGDDNLTWTLLKYIEPDDSHSDTVDYESSVVNYSRLSVALNVIHECFEPVKEAHTGRDTVEDVIFGRWSKLNRLNFQGFYTVVLERNDELITVATLRVHGPKVAEMPLVATQVQHRRLGMCRILMNELEKQLMKLGVERLVLPAVPGVVNAWTTSFGFSRVNQSERKNLLDYTFLDFQDTIMCQKILQKAPSPYVISSGLTEAKHTHFDSTNSKDKVELDDNTAVS